MKKIFAIIFVGFVSISVLTSCTSTQQNIISPPDPTVVNSEEEAANINFPVIGIVSEAIEVQDYVYVQLDDGSNKKIWTAMPTIEVKVGDQLILPVPGLAMPDYRSEYLDRTFGFIYFVSSLFTEEAFNKQGKRKTENSEQASQPSHSPENSHHSLVAKNENSSNIKDIAHNKENLCRQLAQTKNAGKSTTAENEKNIKLCEEKYQRTAQEKHQTTIVDVSNLEKVKIASTGTTIAEVFDQKDKLAGQLVTIRCEVTKYASMIMGTNWAHLQDGTSAQDGNKDLTVTTSAEVKAGDVVMVQGKVTLNKDFGAGYKYDVIIEDASIIVMSSSANP